mgnify:CR=1 FL=1
MEKTKTKKVMPKQEVKKVTEAKKPTGMSKEKKSIIAGLALIVAAAGISAGTYAYYQSIIDGRASGTITPWSFTVNEKGDAQEFIATMGDLKPGVSGQIELNMSAAASGLGVDAVISFNSANNIPANMKFYTDSGYTSELDLSKDTITRAINAGKTDSVTIYYNWPKGSAEKGPKTASTAKITVNVTCTQQNQKPYIPEEN